MKPTAVRVRILNKPAHTQIAKKAAGGSKSPSRDTPDDRDPPSCPPRRDS